MNHSKVCKIVLVGDRNVGKRSLLNRVFNISKRPSPFYIPIECTEIEGTAQDQQVKIHFYDSLIKPDMVAKENNVLVHEFCAEIIPSANVILMCFANDSAQSLLNLQEWFSLIKAHLMSETFIYIVATKSDTQAHIDPEVYERLKREIGSTHGRFRTSSVTGENVQDLFAHIMKNFIKLPFKNNEIILDSDMASAGQGIATPRKSMNPYDTSSFVMITPVKREIFYESSTSIDVAVSRGETAIKTRIPQEVYAARQMDVTSDTIKQNRHTRSASSFAWKQERKLIFDQENKLLQKFVDHDNTMPEDEEEVKMDYLRPGRILSDDLIRFESSYSEKGRTSIRNVKDDSIEIQIRYVKDETVDEKESLRKDKNLIIGNKMESEESDLEIPQHYIKIWF